jgi:two-component system OmpR family sensor kinase
VPFAPHQCRPGVLTFLPRSLAGRTIGLLLIGFAAIQLLGLVIHTLNQINLERIEQDQQFATRAVIIYRHIAAAAPQDRAEMVAREPLPKGDTISLDAGPPITDQTFQLPLGARQIMRASIYAYGIPPPLRPHGLVLMGTDNPARQIISFALPGGGLFGGLPLPPLDLPDALLPPPGMWLTIASNIAAPAPWRSPGFATAFIVMTVLGAAMIIWAVRTLLIPVRTLAAAAERLGRDVVNAPALPETGPTEIVTAAAAFNTMAARIRRFVEDRTFLLTAIGHDLRTPITRLKLRAEYMEDDEQRVKMLADLDEMEAMVAATLAFGRDVTTSEAVVLLDLAVLLRTIIDEAGDGAPEQAAAMGYEGPEHLTVSARPLALKRALQNLIGNALKYGDAARVRLRATGAGLAEIDIEDDGPGIDDADLETVFEPFRRLETSRNRETGGSGLGLSIARNIVRAQGGDIALINMAPMAVPMAVPKPGGLRARVTLPV